MMWVSYSRFLVHKLRRQIFVNLFWPLGHGYWWMIWWHYCAVESFFEKHWVKDMAYFRLNLNAWIEQFGIYEYHIYSDEVVGKIRVSKEFAVLLIKLSSERFLNDMNFYKIGSGCSTPNTNTIINMWYN